MKLWFDSNKLVFNGIKSQYIFSIRYKIKKSNGSVISANFLLKQLASDTRFLGININENLNWTNHIQTLSQKLNAQLYA